MAVQRLSNSGRSGFSYKSLIAGITPLPSVPTIGAATAVTFESVNVAFTAPGAYAGSTYTATSSPGGFTATSATSPILVTGLSELTEYTFTVTATNATGTSGASAASDPVTTPSGDTGAMFPIQMVSVGAAGAANITFSSIPSTYTHLQIRVLSMSSYVATAELDGIELRFNSDSGSNYSYHQLRANGSAATAEAYATQSLIGMWPQTNTTYSVDAFSAGIIDILDYKNTSKYKAVRWFGGVDTNNTGTEVGRLYYGSGLWRNANAVSSIVLQSGGFSRGFLQYSSFALYGIKGA